MDIFDATKLKMETQYKLEDTHIWLSNQCKYIPKCNPAVWPKMKLSCRRKVTKANQILAMIQRNVHLASATTRELTYNALVCPHLEHASVLWSPWQTYLKDAIEKVQRRAACYVCNKHSMVSVTSLISDIKWDTLKLCRIKSSLCTVYKIHHGLVKFPLYQYASPSAITHTRKSSILDPSPISW